MLTSIIILVVLLVLSALFSGTETAFTSLSPVQIEGLKSDFKVRGKLIAKMSKNPDIFITTVLIGNNLMNIGASALATKLTIDLFGSSTIGIMTGVLTLFVLIFGEVTPKRIALLHNEFICLHMIRLIYAFSILLKPVIWFVLTLSSLLTRLIQRKKKDRFSHETILHAVRLAEDRGLLEETRTKMVRGVLRLSETPVKTIMTHRQYVFSLDSNLNIEEAYPLVLEKDFSRIPVFGDSQENIVGIVLMKDLQRAHSEYNQQKASSDMTLKKIMKKPMFVSETKRIQTVLNDMRALQFNIAIVLDEYGGLAGIVTREDILEEIVGELYDEGELIHSDSIVRGVDGRYQLAGNTPLYEFSEFFGLKLPDNTVSTTLSGYLMEVAGNIPPANTTVRTDAGTFLIMKTGRNRIHSCLFSPTLSEEAPHAS